MSQAYEFQETDGLGNFTGHTPQGYVEFIGAEWKKEIDPETGFHPGGVPRSIWAGKIRAALKQAWATDFGDFDPSKVKLTVHTKNYSGGGSITITIEDIADMWRFDYREDCKIREQVKQIASQWQRESSHGQSDYLSNNFMLFVNYGGLVEDDIYNLGPRPVVTDDQYRQAARDEYATSDIDFDDNPKVSESELGAFVQAWVWVPLSNFNEPTPEECVACTPRDEIA